MNKHFWRGFMDGLALRPLWKVLANRDIEEARLAEREECAQLCIKGAASYRAMKGREEPVGVTTGDEEAEELAYCCELNARFIRERSNVI
jgi:hypothetical protein